MFATDHAPHPARTKDKGFAASANGIIGIEAAIPVTYAVMVREEGMAEEAWARAWHEMPLKVIGETGNAWRPSRKTVVATDAELREIDVARFHSIARNSPYGGFKYDTYGKEQTI